MRVIITRPQRSAVHTVERLAGLGHQPILLPLTRAVHAPADALAALTAAHSAMAITSAEAVHALRGLEANLAPMLGEPLFAVGKASAKAAGQFGFTDIRTGPGDGLGLANLVAANISALPHGLVYLAGNPRSPKFEDRLKAAGVRVAAAEIYRMLPIAYDETEIRHRLGRQPTDAVLLYSVENARLFFDGIAPYVETLHDLLILAISPGVVDAVPSQFHRNIKIAAQPDEDGLFALL